MRKVHYLVNAKKTNSKSILKKVSFTLFLSIGSIAQESVVWANDPQSLYFDAFDKKIYSQKRLEEVFEQKEYVREGQYDEALTKAILHVLFSKKIKQLEKKTFKTYDQELADLGDLVQKYRPSSAERAFNLMGSVLSTATSFALFGSLSGAARVAAVGVPMAGAAMRGFSEYLKPDGQLDLDKMSSALERKKKELVMKVNQEPISELEMAYVLKKRFYSTELQEKIEKMLIDARCHNSVPGLPRLRTFLQDFLTLPVQKKEFNPHLRCWDLDNPEGFSREILPDSPDSLIERRNVAKRNLRAYPPEARRWIQSTIHKIMCTSQLNEEPVFCHSHYLYGDPGVGKSKLVHELAVFLGLPFYEMSVHSVHDISRNALEGAEYQNELTNGGHLVRTLTSGYQNGEDAYKYLDIPVERASLYGLPHTFRTPIQTREAIRTYQNGILVMDDLDRHFRDPNSASQVMAFLLDYLDPDKKEIVSRYFSGAKLKIDGLHIFITSNTPIPTTISQSTAPKVEVPGPFEALRDRLDEVQFNPLDQGSQQILLSEFFDQKQRTYQLTPRAQFKTTVLAAAIGASLRTAKKIVEDAIVEERLAQRPYRLIGTETPIQTIVEPFDNAVFQPLITFPPVPPSFLNEEPDVLRNVQTLHGVSQTAKLLASLQQANQHNGIKKLFGEASRFWFDSVGSIRYLWKSHRLSGPHREAVNNLGALANRLQRFIVPAQRHLIFHFHVELLKSIADILLNFKETGDEGFIFQEMTRDRVRKTLLGSFISHLQVVSRLKGCDRCGSEELTYKDKKTLENYVLWFGEGQNTKAALLLQKYHLEG